jgi:hypothetical protein
MRTRFALALVLVACCAATALACGSRTIALIEAAATMERLPAFRCGPMFNEMLARARVKVWKGALAAYETHLGGIGKWKAGSADALETLDYLRRKAETQK